VRGSGYLPGTRVDLSVTVRLHTGGSQTLTAAATTDASGHFAVALRIPAAAGGGSYTLLARSASGRSASARLLIAKLAPSVVAVPATAVPGTQVTVNGFGFAAGQTVTLRLNGQALGNATTNTNGQFSVKLTIPQNLATGTYTLSATSVAGRIASVRLAVNRTVATHFYFASLYTGAGYHESLAFLNPTAIQARVQITYQPRVPSRS
jgi:5-hydroxyisourate hydrolase-like protein (transthyretin family)